MRIDQRPWFWPALLLASSLVSSLLLMLGFALTWRRLDEANANTNATRTQLAGIVDLQQATKDELERQNAATWVDAKDTINNCVADNTSASCTVTNLTDKPIVTCLQGVVTQKKASGVNLHSLAMCTGRLEAFATREMSAPWVGGFARDICSSTDRFGNEMLDWQACTFNSKPVSRP